MAREKSLPPSLAVFPNIPVAAQTIDQLRAERDFWQDAIDATKGWGASLRAAIVFRDACVAEIERRAGETGKETKPTP